MDSAVRAEDVRGAEGLAVSRRPQTVPALPAGRAAGEDERPREAPFTLDCATAQGLEGVLDSFVQTCLTVIAAAMENLEDSVASRKVYVMFEDALGCDPATDHLSPKSLLPIYLPALSAARERLQQLVGPVARMQLRADLTGLLREASARASSLGSLLSDALHERGIALQQLQMLEERVARYLTEASEDKAALMQYILTLKEQFQQRKKMASDNLSYKPDFMDVEAAGALAPRQLVIPTGRRRGDAELLERARRDVAALQAELQGRDAAIRALQDQLDAAKAASAQAEEARARALQLQHQLEAVLKGEEALKARLAELEEEKAMLLDRVVDARAEADAQKLEADHSRRELAALMALSDKQKAEAAEAVSAAEVRAERCASRLAELDAALKEARGEIASLRGASAELQARANSLARGADRSAMPPEYEALRGEAEELRRKLGVRSRQCEDLEADNQRLRAAAERFQRLLKAREAQIVSMRQGGVGLLPERVSSPSPNSSSRSGDAGGAADGTVADSAASPRSPIPPLSPLPQIAEPGPDSGGVPAGPRGPSPASPFERDLDQIMQHTEDLCRIEEATREARRAWSSADFACQVPEAGATSEYSRDDVSRLRAGRPSIGPETGREADQDADQDRHPGGGKGSHAQAAPAAPPPSRQPASSSEPKSNSTGPAPPPDGQAIIMSESPMLGMQAHLPPAADATSGRSAARSRLSESSRAAAELRARAAAERVIRRPSYGAPRALRVDHEVIDFESMPEVFKRLSSEADVLRLKLQGLKEKWLGVERQKLDRLLRRGPRIMRGSAALSVVFNEDAGGRTFAQEPGVRRVYEKGILGQAEPLTGPGAMTRVHARQGYFDLLEAMRALLQHSPPRPADAGQGAGRGAEQGAGRGSGRASSPGPARPRDADRYMMWNPVGDGRGAGRAMGEGDLLRVLSESRGDGGEGARSINGALQPQDSAGAIPEWLRLFLAEVYAANSRSPFGDQGEQEGLGAAAALDTDTVVAAEDPGRDYSDLRLDYSGGLVSGHPAPSQTGGAWGSGGAAGKGLSARLQQVRVQSHSQPLTRSGTESSAEQALVVSSRGATKQSLGLRVPSGPTATAPGDDLRLSRTLDEMVGLGQIPRAAERPGERSAEAIAPAPEAGALRQRVAETLEVQNTVSSLSNSAVADTSRIRSSLLLSGAEGGAASERSNVGDSGRSRAEMAPLLAGQDALHRVLSVPTSQAASGPRGAPSGLVQRRAMAASNSGGAGPSHGPPGSNEAEPTSAMLRAMEARSLPGATAAVAIANVSLSLKRRDIELAAGGRGGRGGRGGIYGSVVRARAGAHRVERPEDRSGRVSPPREAQKTQEGLTLSGHG